MAIITPNLLSSAPSEDVFFIGPILTITVMLLFLARASSTETPYWNKRAETAFYLFATPISAVFLIVIAVKIALVLSGR
jgi:hypothetical protein